VAPRAYAWLPDGQFQALWLRYAEDMDIEHIARVLGKTQTHIKVLLFRARHKLATELEAPLPQLVLNAKGASL
jgi:DNA-directed RNA polymerase specialized sigma24 family protein